MKISAPIMAYVIDPLERAARTFVQQFVVTLMAVGTAGLLVHQNWLLSLDGAAFAAAVSILTSVLTFKVKPLSVPLDLGLRVGKTFVQSFVGTLTASNILSVAHADWHGALAIAFPVALTALLTGLAAMGLPGTVGASLLPAGFVTAVDVAGQDEVDPQLAANAPLVLASLNAGNDPAAPVAAPAPEPPPVAP